MQTHFLELLASEAWVVGAPTLVETRAWCALNLPARKSRWLEDVVEADGVSVVPFGRDMADIVSRTFWRHTERKAFFFEKKNQKTFIPPGGDTQTSGLNDTSGAKSKSFLLLFFKKEDFLPLIAFLPTWAVTFF